MKVYFKDWLKRERIKKGLSQAELAEKSGVVLYTISNYERGLTKPRIDKVKKLCEALDVEVTKITKYLGD